MPVDDTHECPAPGCYKRCKPNLFACAVHWMKLPGTLRNKLSRAWRREEWGPYMEAHAECTDWLAKNP